MTVPANQIPDRVQPLAVYDAGGVTAVSEYDADEDEAILGLHVGNQTEATAVFLRGRRVKRIRCTAPLESSYSFRRTKGAASGNHNSQVKGSEP